MMTYRSACLLLAVFLVACSGDSDDMAPDLAAPWVLTAPLQAARDDRLQLTGSVRARYETPVSFQVNGRILQRHANAGDRVERGQLLFSLDPRDLEQGVNIAQARLGAARAALETVESELARQRQLVAQNFVSPQTVQRFELAVREARSQLATAEAELRQARNQRSYADLHAEQAGTLIEVSGEPGQVVQAGQTVAVLAQAGEREVEVFLPSDAAPRAGSLDWRGGSGLAISLREMAGAADPDSRTWRARYQLAADQLPLGEVVQVSLVQGAEAGEFVVPVTALDERAESPRIWLLRQGRAEPVFVQVVRLARHEARVRGELEVGARIIRLGTHLLEPGMPVRERG